MLQKYHSDRTQLPDAWQMAWVIRNGLSHNGKVHFDPPKQTSKKTPKLPAPVHWQGLKIGPEHQGQTILGNFLNVGDLIVLSIEMEQSLSGKVPWQLMREQNSTTDVATGLPRQRSKVGKDFQRASAAGN